MLSNSTLRTVSLSLRLKNSIIDWLFENLSLEITLEDIDKIDRLDELIAYMIEENYNLLFNFRIRDPEFAMGRNAQHACEHYERDVYDEDDVIFTGYWQHV